MKMQDTSNEQPEGVAENQDESQTQTFTIDPEKLARYNAQLEQEQNFSMGLIAGIIACLVTAVIWATITYYTQYQIGYMSIGVGFIVGMAIRIAGKGITMPYAIMGALFALLGCVLGNFFTMVAFSALQFNAGIFEILMELNIAEVPSIIIETFDPMDALFYGIAIYIGFRSAKREITEEELIEHAT